MTAVNIRMSSRKSHFSELALANIEALARDESATGKPCTVTGYSEVWYHGCLYTCVQCAEGHYKLTALIRCMAK